MAVLDILLIQLRIHCVQFYSLLFGSRPSDHYFRSVCLSVCLFVCAVFLSRLLSDFDLTRTHVICLGLVVSRRI